MDLTKVNLSDFITEVKPNNNTFFKDDTDSLYFDNIKNSLYKFKERSKDNLLMIIDGSSILSSAYYADTNPRLTSEGLNTNAILGAMRTISSLIYFQKPTHFVVTLDRTRMTFRVLEYAKYKSNRKPTPDELKKQFILFEEVLRNVGIPVLVTKEGAPQEETYEADDYSATVVEMFKDDIPIVLYSKDTDYLQLASDDTVVYLISQKARQYAKSLNIDTRELNIPPNSFPFNTETLKHIKGMSGEQVIQYKAYVGDNSDCIPGVPGIGPKVGPLIIDAFEDLSSLYKEIDGITDDKLDSLAEYWETNYGISKAKNVIKKLQKGKDMAYLSERLGTMRRDIPLKIALLDLKLNIRKNSWNKEMRRLEIHSLYLK